MSNANPSQLFLLADHIKLSLLERERALTLNLSPNSHDSQISRSLDSLHQGIEGLEAQILQSPNSDLEEQLSRLRIQYQTLSSQFSPGVPTSKPSTATPVSPPLSNSTNNASGRQVSSKSVRFTDNPSDEERDPNRDALFPYRDNPSEDDLPDPASLSNQQIHDYHTNVMREQDEQLDRLGESIGRQRDLSIQIGDELDQQALMLDDVDAGVDRHQSQLDRAQRRLKGVARKARENWTMTTIVVLIVILVLLIVITK